ncbi:Csu type fimbrial protein [Acidisoma silvae]|uniref:Spore coat U domain-containing protein n=1 Tax=Acidisoma silvae TaxID=2802396 RepID=A0A964E074_9PROT|nr:spore coat U domain-containing protein [Acidisoma silvae]MCB8876869.1 spore coat U domain-containing protein [Acidisoma silvae]
MIRSVLRGCLILLSLVVGNVLVSVSAHASVVCSDSSPSINFGSVNVTTSTGASATGSVGYTCTNYNNTAVSFDLCLGMGTPSYPGTASQPEMQGSGTLKFNLYTNAPDGTIWTTTTPISVPVSIAAGIGKSVSGTFTFYGYIPGSQTAAAGNYSAYFYNVLLGFMTGTQCGSLNGYSGLDFTLPVTAVVTNNCVVGASSDLSFGSVSATAKNVTGSNTLVVSCPSGTPYYIGLAPSNGSTTGAGVMAGTGSNTDKVPYQLRSGSASGAVWGNTATSTKVGNGVAGNGTGTSQSITVYASAASADYTPDTYTDTVTVDLNY